MPSTQRGIPILTEFAFGAGAGSVKGPTALSALEDAENSVFISTDCRGADSLNNNTNSIVIGANAIGEGSNTTAINTTTKTITAAAIKLEGKVTLAVPQGDISMGIYQ